MSDETPTPSTTDIRDKAAKTAADGLQSYAHGSRQVNRSNPETLLDAADRIDRRAARASRGICAMVCNEVGGP